MVLDNVTTALLRQSPGQAWQLLKEWISGPAATQNYGLCQSKDVTYSYIKQPCGWFISSVAIITDLKNGISVRKPGENNTTKFILKICTVLFLILFLSQKQVTYTWESLIIDFTFCCI